MLFLLRGVFPMVKPMREAKAEFTGTHRRGKTTQ
jgi:hypothetical protein